LIVFKILFGNISTQRGTCV